MEAGLASMTSNVKSRLEVKIKRSAWLVRLPDIMVLMFQRRGDP